MEMRRPPSEAGDGALSFRTIRDYADNCRMG